MRKISESELKGLKKLIWLYFFLLLFEGALRKWVLPSLSTPLLIVRDPIAFWIIVKALRANLFPVRNIYIVAMISVTILSSYMSLIFGHGNITVMIYGARIFFLHFPLIFVIGKIFDKKDVEQIGRLLLWITIPMTVLLMLQFYNPQSAWVNRGIGGDLKGSGFSGVTGYFRASTTFSFANGTSLYYAFVGCYIFYFSLNSQKVVHRYLLILAMACLIAAIPLSISRTLFFSITITILFVIISFIRRPKDLIRIMILLSISSIFFFILNKLSFFQTASGAFMERFTSANKAEGGVESVFIDRFLGGMIGAIFNSNNLPFWGYGIGMGTNAGAKILTGKNDFLISEGEWGRLIGEMGIFMGIIVIYIRTQLAIKLLINSFREIRKSNLLPWLLLSFGFFNILQGQWAQPTSLGFSILTGGLIIASREKKMI